MTKKRLKYKVCVCDVVMVQMRAENSIYKVIFYQGYTMNDEWNDV